MTDENRSTAAGMAVTLSVGLISVSLAVIAAVVAYTFFVLDKSAQELWFYVLICLSLSSFIASVYSGGKGIDKVRKAGYHGDWTPIIGRRYFNLQAILLIGGTLFLCFSFLTVQRGAGATMGNVLAELKNHTALLNGILNKTGPTPDGGSNSGATTLSLRSGLFILVSSLVLLLVGGWVSFSHNSNTAILGRIAFGLGGLSLFAGSTLELGGVTCNLPPWPRPSDQRLETIVFEKLPTVGPFGDASDQFENANAAENLLATMKRRLVQDTLQSLIIIGGADKRRLNSMPGKRFGSNVNLALARASHVRNLLMRYQLLSSSQDRIVTLTTGSENIGEVVLPNLLADNRRVQIFAYWKLGQRRFHEQ